MAVMQIPGVEGFSSVVAAYNPDGTPISGVGSGAVTLTRNASATYMAVGTGYTAYATPTDLFTIRGSASKTIAIVAMNLRVNTTVAALQTVYWIKRSTANTGGTSTNPAAIPFNSSRAAATAQIDLYTVAPTLGTAVATMAYQAVLTTVPTAVPGIYALNSIVSANGSAVTLTEPLVLRGVAEMLCCNWNGAALPTGFTAQWDVTWVEY